MTVILSYKVSAWICCRPALSFVHCLAVWPGWSARTLCQLQNKNLAIANRSRTPASKKLPEQRSSAFTWTWVKAHLVGSEFEPGWKHTWKGQSLLQWSECDVVDAGSNNSAYYELQAVLTHKGRSSSSGHYVAWVKSSKQGHSPLTYCHMLSVLYAAFMFSRHKARS